MYMKNIFVLLLIALFVTNCGGEQPGETHIDKIKQLLQLSVLEVNSEDAFVDSVNLGSPDDPDYRTMVYRIEGKLEYRYDLEKAQIDSTGENSYTVTLPPCSVSFSQKEPNLEYAEKGGWFDEAVGNEADLKVRKKITQQFIAKYNSPMYQQQAFDRAKTLLETFLKGTNCKVTIKQDR
jgi:hypothetical protein